MAITGVKLYQERSFRKSPDREVLISDVGELMPHDMPYHLWAPQAEIKWYLLTSIDDRGRGFFSADLWEREYSLAHNVAGKTVVTHGLSSEV